MSDTIDPREGFEPTECSCRGCVACCEHMPGMLTVGDLEALAAALQIADFSSWLLEHFQASAGAVVIYQGELLRIPTIVPKLTGAGCVFLKGGLCSVYVKAPFGCRYYDTHMSGEEGNRRSQGALFAILQDFQQRGPYFQAWQQLANAGCLAPPVETRRANLAAALEVL